MEEQSPLSQCNDAIFKSTLEVSHVKLHVLINHCGMLLTGDYISIHLADFLPFFTGGTMFWLHGYYFAHKVLLTKGNTKIKRCAPQVPFRVDSFSEGRDNNLKELSPHKAYPIPFKQTHAEREFLSLLI